MPPPQVRVGMLGAGYIARLHVEKLTAIPGAGVVAVCDPRREQAEALAASCDARAYERLDDMLEGEELHALYICIPPFAHGAPERAALERGLAIFVEKPLAIDLATAEALADEIEQHAAVAAVGYHWRHLDLVTQAREELLTRPARLVLGYWLSNTPGAQWWGRRNSSGGQMLEQTTHIFDLARLLVGEVASVHALGTKLPREGFPEHDIFDVSLATLRFTSGAVGTIASTCLLQSSHRVGLHLFGEGVALELSAKGRGGTAPYELLVDEGSGPRLVEGANDPLLAEDEEFIAAVRGERTQLTTSYRDALASHRAAVAATEAADEGKGVVLETLS